MQVWNVLHAARWKYRTQKIAKNSPSVHHRTTLSGYIFATKADSDNRKKKLVRQQYLPHMSTCPHIMVNFGPRVAEISSVVWGTQSNFNGFRVLASLLHGIRAVGANQTLRRWTEGASYIRQSGHHVGHWPTFLVCVKIAVKTQLTCLFDFYSQFILNLYSLSWQTKALLILDTIS